MIFRKNLFLGLLLTFSLAFNLAFAGVYIYQRTSTRRHEEAPGRGRPSREKDISAGKEWRESLGLTEEQQKLLEEKREDLRSELRAQREKARQIRERLVQMLEDPDAGQDEIVEVAEEYHEIQQRIRARIFQDLLEMRQMLDREQRRRFGRSLMRGPFRTSPRNEKRGDPGTDNKEDDSE